MLVSQCANAYRKDYLEKNRASMGRQAWQAIEDKCGNKISSICIFGAGLRGKKLYYAFMKHMIEVECFSDNSPDKWGYFVDNTLCVPPDYLEMDKEDMLVVIAIKGETEMLPRLKSLGMKNVVPEAEIYEILAAFPDVMPVGCIENIDYTSKECSYLTGKFNILLRDTCRYYEQEIDKLKAELEEKSN